MKIFLFFIVLCILIVILLRYTARVTLLRGRENRPLEELYRSFVFNTSVDLDTFVKVISLVAKCYHIAPGKLRADDRFDRLFAKLDSWDLGNGTENLQDKVERNFSLHLPEDTRLNTVRELIEYCHAHGNPPPS
ncbi:MAG: hypothetical protein M9963_04165 [Kiritimatiellae bacterium]|nr:hypothetical protein [Kiritimatiellia bacterium]